ncbi:penicillin-binding transpeptidase domain-containing protein [Kitasatospora sp. NPDC006697]|uniref:penicillin-binding transpeptidase domain-containing protein n=1 Tax=Kitasatospora sp. NPDC006697 TaxID=3364020 RepID=UPI00369A8A3B
MPEEAEKSQGWLWSDDPQPAPLDDELTNELTDEPDDRPDDEFDGEFDDTPEDAEDPDPARRSGRRALLIGSAVVFTVLLAVGGIAVYNLGSAVFGGPPAHDHTTATTPTAPPDAAQATAAAQAFLTAWAGGDATAAGALTDNPYTAATRLADFKQKLAFSSLALTVGSAVVAPRQAAPETVVKFKATVAFPAAGANQAPWTYDGSLTVRQSGGGGKPVVHWDSTVINPALTGGRSIALRAVSPSAAVPVDRKGRSLAGFPSLPPLLAALHPADDSSPGTGDGQQQSGNGSAVVLTENPGGHAQQLYVISQPSAAPQQRLTLDADVQRAAEAAVAAQSASGKPAGLVAIEPSTGDILAVANAPAGGFNQAFLAKVAPGSTLKVVTAAALLEAGDSPDTPVPCPDTANSPRLWHNDEDGSHPDYTLADDFAHSCNTAFIRESQSKLAPGTLPAVALQQFGLGLTWSTAPGVENFDAVVPAPQSSDDAAAEAIGQYTVVANPLAMASVAATVQSGTFRQPILLPGQPQVTTAKPLPAAVAAQLRTMMARAAASGTAQQAMAGLSGQVGAKTGTADVDGAAAPNSWFIGYRGDLAVAAEVEGGGHGAGAAGAAVASVLAVGNG